MLNKLNNLLDSIIKWLEDVDANTLIPWYIIGFVVMVILFG